MRAFTEAHAKTAEQARNHEICPKVLPPLSCMSHSRDSAQSCGACLPLKKHQLYGMLMLSEGFLLHCACARVMIQLLLGQIESLF